jgi:hypothetical protein
MTIRAHGPDFSDEAPTISEGPTVYSTYFVYWGLVSPLLPDENWVRFVIRGPQC